MSESQFALVQLQFALTLRAGGNAVAGNGQREVLVLEDALAEVLHRLTVAEELPLGGEQAFDAHWATGVNAPRGDAHLGAQAEAVAIGEASGGIVEDAGTVHGLHELIRSRFFKGEC